MFRYSIPHPLPLLLLAALGMSVLMGAAPQNAGSFEADTSIDDHAYSYP